MNQPTSFLTALSAQYPDFKPDPAQAKALTLLDERYRALTQPIKKILWFVKPKAVKGLYLWGPVGRGKSYVMDRFYELLPITQKKREHFHEFMQAIHTQLTALQGEKDPLKKIARDLSATVRVICFDEFIVNDIATAMLLGRLFTALFEAGIVLIATSNTRLDDLYRDGLQRDRFLPAIEVLKAHVNELQVDYKTDYRLQEEGSTHSYFSPLNATTALHMQQTFEGICQRGTASRGNVSASHTSGVLEIAGRDFPYLAQQADIIWFEFETLCVDACGATDYLVLAQSFHTIFVSGVPDLATQSNNAVARFINLIDVLYDEQIRVILSCEKPIADLYRTGELSQTFERTQSRLYEMQTERYRERTLSRKYRKESRI